MRTPPTPSDEKAAEAHSEPPLQKELSYTEKEAGFSRDHARLRAMRPDWNPPALCLSFKLPGVKDELLGFQKH